jgi:hypothetical protein
MTREELIEKLIPIYKTIPDGATPYHIIDIILGAAERRGADLGVDDEE